MLNLPEKKKKPNKNMSDTNALKSYSDKISGNSLIKFKLDQIKQFSSGKNTRC